MEGVALAIKPHTRGMKFNFMSEGEIGNAVIATSVPSPVLIEWADILLFTGSSVAFHAMQLSKDVGLLNYCKSLETIFDDGKVCTTFNDLQQLENYVRNFPSSAAQPNQQVIKEWLESEVYAGLPDNKIALHYKDLIIRDLGKTL